MKQITLDTVAYTNQVYAENDAKAFKSKADIWRYRSDVFPNPYDFKLKIEAISAEIVKRPGSALYPYRLRVCVYFDDAADDGRIEAYKSAMERKARFFDASFVERRNDRKPVAEKKTEKPVEKTEPKKTDHKTEKPAEKTDTETKKTEKTEEPKAEKPVKERKKRGRKKKTIEEQIADQAISDEINKAIRKKLK